MTATDHRFTTGDRVRILEDNPDGNPRTPGYARGRTGVVTDLHGVIENPRDHRVTYPPLCTVVIPVARDRGGLDVVAVDIHEDWLEPVEPRGAPERRGH